MALMGVAMLAYVVLDGYDLGVGLLLHRATPPQRDTMIASIGPFWDANETWLVLGVGILLIAFPKAHGLVLTALYLPVTLMLVGLVLRGVAFDFRVKAQDGWKPLWNFAFWAGSGLAAASQGWMLGRYITGFAEGGDREVAFDPSRMRVLVEKGSNAITVVGSADAIAAALARPSSASWSIIGHTTTPMAESTSSRGWNCAHRSGGMPSPVLYPS